MVNLLTLFTASAECHPGATVADRSAQVPAPALGATVKLRGSAAMVAGGQAVSRVILTLRRAANGFARKTSRGLRAERGARPVVHAGRAYAGFSGMRNPFSSRSRAPT